MNWHSVRGLGVASGAFGGSFALHIVFGAADLSVLFKVAVVMIFASAVFFPVIALAGSRIGFQSGGGPGMVLVGMLIGSVLTTATLWATAGRELFWWQPIVAPVIVGVSSAIAFGATERLNRGRKAPAPVLGNSPAAGS
jgi:threonine/homoserine efflux transporter RhtA